MKHKLLGDASERCLQESGDKYNNKFISTTVKHGGRAFLAAGIVELLHCEK